MKIRLWRGPLSGKVIEGYFGDIAVVTGPKKMSRKQMDEWRMSNDWNFLTPDAFMRPFIPMVKCQYRRVRVTTAETNSGSVVFHDIPAVHPDGSWFYAYERTISEYPRTT